MMSVRWTLPLVHIEPFMLRSANLHADIPSNSLPTVILRWPQNIPESAATEKSKPFHRPDNLQVRDLYELMSLRQIHAERCHCGRYYQEIRVEKKSLRPYCVMGIVMSPRSSTDSGGLDVFTLQPSAFPRLDRETLPMPSSDKQKRGRCVTGYSGNFFE
jgi:hypothetical protein